MNPFFDFRRAYRSPFADAFFNDFHDPFFQDPFAHDRFFFNEPLLFARRPATALIAPTSSEAPASADGSVAPSAAADSTTAVAAPEAAAAKDVAPVSAGSYFSHVPALHVLTRDNEYVVKCDVPGVRKEDLKIELNERSNGSSYLTISGERRSEEKSEDKDRGFFSERRSFGSFSRSIPVPEHVKVGEIKADYKDGVLELTLPRDIAAAAPKRSRSIELK